MVPIRAYLFQIGLALTLSLAASHSNSNLIRIPEQNLSYLILLIQLFFDSLYHLYIQHCIFHFFIHQRLQVVLFSFNTTKIYSKIICWPKESTKTDPKLFKFTPLFTACLARKILLLQTPKTFYLYYSISFHTPQSPKNCYHLIIIKIPLIILINQ